MRIDLNARVKTRDGADAGKIRYAIFNPDLNDVSHFVVSTGGLFGKDVVVPAEAVAPPEIAEDRSYNEDVVVLGLSTAELEAIPAFDPLRYGEPPMGWAYPATGDYAAASYLWPANPVQDAFQQSIEPESRGEIGDKGATIAKGSSVFDQSGDDVGIVEDLRFGTIESDLHSLVIRVGGVLQTLFGGGETVEVPKEMIASVTPDGVHLRVTKEEIRQMAGADEPSR